MTRGYEKENQTNGVRLHGKATGWPHWTTPKYVLDIVQQLGPIHLDPCWNEQAITAPLVKVWCGALDLDWHEIAGGGLIFVNPPYDKAAAFVAKAIEEANKGARLVLLVAARTDTKWSHSLFTKANAVCFWGPGRIKFENPPPASDGKAPSIASAFWHFGKERKGFFDAFRPHGFCFDLVKPRETFPVRRTVEP